MERKPPNLAGLDAWITREPEPYEWDAPAIDPEREELDAEWNARWDYEREAYAGLGDPVGPAYGNPPMTWRVRVARDWEYFCDAMMARGGPEYCRGLIDDEIPF